MHGVAFLKLLVGITLGISGLIQIFSKDTWGFIQNVNLIFHEAGHFIFWPLGELMMFMGGSLLEILVPLIVIFSFWRTRQFFSAAFASWWLATALLSVSIYAADARERALPLITNDINTHDWFNILVKLGLLRYDDLFGYFFWILSVLSIALLILFLSHDKHIKLLLHRHTLS